MNRKNIVSNISRVIHEIAPDSIAILYGSEARGESRPDSDIDILVLLTENNDSYARRKIDITERLYEIELNYGVSISPLIVMKNVWDKMKTPFTYNVTRDGIAI